MTYNEKETNISQNNLNLVSILLPTHNGALYLHKAIESVLAQTYQDWELLVIDDGSVDDTRHITENFAAQDPRIMYLKNEQNLGIQKTLNVGLRTAIGEYIARIDDDDRWMENDKLERQVAYLHENPDCVLVGTGTIILSDTIVDEPNETAHRELIRYLVPETDREIRNKLLSKNCFVHSSVVFRKAAALQCGGYDESIESRHIEDYDLWLKLGTKGELHNLPIHAVALLMREDSLSGQNKVAQFRKSLRLIKKYKSSYPNYFSAHLRSWVRLIVYGFIVKMPIKISLARLRKLDKEKW
jgi:glycosyltransferase involved in cell wall biosynthesis